MKKVFLSITVAILFSLNTFAQNAVIKGTVKNSPTDTIYLQTMPFHSPYSSEVRSLKISPKGEFKFEFDNVEKAFVVQIYLEKKYLKANKEYLLWSNYLKTEECRSDFCNKFYQYFGTATFFLEPNKTIDVKIERYTSRKKVSKEQIENYNKNGVEVAADNTVEVGGETRIIFKGKDIFQEEYFQKSLNRSHIIGKRLAIYKSMSMDKAIKGYQKSLKQLLDDLNEVKNKLSPACYNYIKAEIEFGAKREFLTFLDFVKYTRPEELDIFYANEVPKNITDIIEIGTKEVNYEILISQKFNKYLMSYLNYILNLHHKSYKRYYDYDLNKIRGVIQRFPKESAYYFLANYLLDLKNNRQEMEKEMKNKDAVEELILGILKHYPNGELNQKIMEKYDL